jgi:hypothetical protein
VPFAPGGTTDILARTVGEKSVGRARPAGDHREQARRGRRRRCASYVAKAAPDGYTIMGGTISTHAINASLYKNLPYDPIKDFVPIVLLARVPNMLVVNVDVPAKSVAELIALLKANPGKYSFASSGNGTSQHLSGELFKSMSGTEMQHIPYKGSPPALQDVVGGQVTMTFDNITTAWTLAKAGKLRALAVTTAKSLRSCARCAHAGGIRARRLRSELVAGRVRACGYAAGHRQASQRRDRENPEHPRREGKARESRPRRRRQHARGVPGDGEGRSSEVGRRRQEVRRKGRLRGPHVRALPGIPDTRRRYHRRDDPLRDRRERSAAADAAWVPADARDVARGGTAACRIVHRRVQRPAGLWRFVEARGGGNHANYSKRAMAPTRSRRCARSVSRASAGGHDRGARVSHRLCVDHPDAVERVALLDISPTRIMYGLRTRPSRPRTTTGSSSFSRSTFPNG